MPSAADVIRIAKSQVGVHEGRSGGQWNNDQRYSDEVPGFAWSDGQPWCDTFVAWCSWQAGMTEDQWPRSASCDASGAAFKKMNRWSEYPAVGAQVLFGTPSDLQHTGIVVKYDDTHIWTVEGNTNASGSYQGDGVYAKMHERRDARVIGYGYPKYPEGIVSADPAWQQQPNPKPAQKIDLRVDGVDISHFQDGPIDYAAAKAAGLKWMYHKATEGTTWTDANYARRRDEAGAAGIPFGAYHFARPSADDAATEARHFLDFATPKPGDLLPMLDLEDDGKLSRAALTSWVAVWAGAIRSALGVWPILYTPFDLDKSLNLLLWVARYNNENAAPKVPAPWTQWDIRQFSNGVFGVPNQIDGFGHVDLNTMRDGLTVDDITIPAPVTTFDFQVVTANIRHALDADAVTTTLNRLAKSTADVVALQEMGARRAQYEAVEGFQAVAPEVPGTAGESANPILARTSVFTVRREESVQVTDRTKVPSAAAGPSDLPPYFITHAALLHTESGRTIHTFCLHMPASQQIDELRALADQAAKGLADMVSQVSGQVIVAGDFNTEKPLELGGGALVNVGLQDAGDILGDVDTHGKRAIDRILFRGLRLEAANLRALDGLPSDHRPLLGRFRLEGKA